jgi:hypothetical protein
MIKENSANLTPTEIAVYAELTCYADKNGVAYPSETRMSAELNIGEEKLRKALNGLKTKGKILIQRAKHNTYTLLESLENGFSKLSKTVMTDKNLTLKAKLIYVFHTVFADFKDVDYTEGGRTYPKRSQIKTTLGIGSDVTYYKHFNLLKAHGYVEVYQRYESGRFRVNDYVLTQNPEKTLEMQPEIKNVRNIAYGEKDENGKFRPLNIVTYVKDGIKKIAKATGKATQAISEKVKNIPQKIKKTVLPKQSFFVGMNISFKEKCELIRKNVQLDGSLKLYTEVLKNPEKITLVNTAFSTMCECLKQNKDFKICGNSVTANEVQEIFLTMDWETFETAISTVYEKICDGEQIRNLKYYLISTLYNTAKSFELSRLNS